MTNTSSVIFWGAGATARLGMRVTAQQGEFVIRLTGADKDSDRLSLSARIDRTLKTEDAKEWHHLLDEWCDLLKDLLTILGDGEESNYSIGAIEDQHLETMARHWTPGAGEDELRKRILMLRLNYDWPALKQVTRICPGAREGHLSLNDLFNVIDMHAPLGHGFRAEEELFLDTRRLVGAKAMLQMLVNTMFYIDYQICIRQKTATLESYYDFAVALGKRMQQAGRSIREDFDRPEFIRGDVSFVSLNYDPIALWLQFVANRNLNRSPSVPHVGSPAAPLQLFHDLGHFIPSRRVTPGRRPALWYPMNEASAQRLNEAGPGGHQRNRLTKFLLPHGCICWRECPDCGKLSAYFGDEWGIASPSLIPPPPLKGFDRRTTSPDDETLHPSDKDARQEEINAWERGAVDARACLHCKNLTFAYHTQAIMQSSFKKAPPSFIDEIQRDLRALVMRANHIIFMGYSLPLDDVTYRSFFAARRQRSKDSQDSTKTPRCTIVDYDRNKPHWICPADLDQDDFPVGSAVRSALEIFGKGNVRYYGGGVPDVFLDATGTVTAQRLEHLLTWPVS